MAATETHRVIGWPLALRLEFMLVNLLFQIGHGANENESRQDRSKAVPPPIPAAMFPP